MKILQTFKNWQSEIEERRQFREYWIDKNKRAFSGLSAEFDEYNSDVAFELAKLQNRVEALEGK